MDEILNDMLQRLEERNNEISSLKNQLICEKLKTAILRLQLRDKYLTTLQLLQIVKANKDFNQVLHEVLTEE